MRILGIDHAQVMIPRGAEAEARRFYCELLGLVEIEKPAPLRARGGFWLQAGAHQIHVGVEDAPIDRAKTRAHVAYAVVDLAAWRAHLTAHGVAVVEGTQIDAFARIELRDPFGNRIELVEPRQAQSRQ